MQSKYFNELEFKNAYSMIDIDPYEAKSRLEEYINKYPNDYIARTYYSYILIVIGKFDEAEKVINQTKKISYLDSHYFSLTEKFGWIKYGIVLNEMRLLARKGKYAELKKLFSENNYIVINGDFRYIPFYCNKKLGLANALLDGDNYLTKQVKSYDEERFFDHIKKHMINEDENDEYYNNSVFLEDFDVRKVVSEIKKLIPNEKKLCTGFFEDSYYFKYDNCGRCDNKLQDFFKLIAFHDTCDFITMYPCSSSSNMPHIDLNYLAEQSINKNQKKIKKLSAIEKFNLRYKDRVGN